MKNTINSNQLLDLITPVVNAVESKPVMPILENILIDVQLDTIIVSGGSMEVTVINKDNFNTDVVAKTLVDAKTLSSLLKTFKNQPLELEFTKTHLEVNSMSGSYKLPAHNPEEYPTLNDNLHDAIEVNFNAHLYKDAIEKTLVSASMDNLRPTMAGILIDFKGLFATFVSTDAHRLATYEIENNKNVSGQTIIPKGMINATRNLDAEFTTIKTDFKNIKIQMGNVTIYSKLIEGKYPPYDKVIPDSEVITLEIEKNTILGALNRLRLVSNKDTFSVTLHVTKDKLIMESKDLDFKLGGKETISIHNSTEEEIKIALNLKLFSELIATFDTDTFNFGLIASDKAIRLYDKNNYLAILMPLTLK